MSTAKLKAALKKHAYAHDGVDEEVSCAGTAIESTKYTVKNKAFLFVGNQDPLIARLKLDASIADAKKRAERAPDAVNVGNGGWTKLTFVDGALDDKTVAHWIDESYALFAASSAKPKTKTTTKTKTKTTTKKAKATAKRTR